MTTSELPPTDPGCSCGCGVVASTTEADTCACGCTCCEPPRDPEDEIAELRRARATIDERLAELGAA